MYKNLAGGSRLNFRYFYLLILLLALLPLSLPAQTSSTAALTGTVTDPTGGVIANATVTATNTGNGQVRTATTGSDGVYKITLLPPGTYSVKFEASGFETSQVPAVQLDVTETPVLNRTLPVGAQSQQVTVEAETETIQTASSALGTVVAAQTVTDIPLSSRNYLNLISLSAGASASVNNADQPGKGSTFLFVNGQNDEQNNFQMDGAVVDNWFSFGTANDNGFYAAIPIPNPDAIQEFKIQTSTYDAGYGRNPGANVNVVTKSGTNAFHGAAFEFFRNTDLNANEWFYKRSELGNLLNGAPDPLPNKQPVLNQNQYGGAFGGPIKKDKLFFFVSYQETSQKNGLTAYGLQSPVLPPIPTPAGGRGTCTTPNWTSLSQCDAATTTFVNALATAISPNCPGNGSIAGDKVNAAVGGLQVACPSAAFTGSNVVTGPQNLYNINPVAINILQLKLANGNYYIPGSTTGPYQPNTFSIPATYEEHQGLGNLDYAINSNNNLAVRFIYSTDPTTGAFGCGIMGTGTCIPGGPVTFQYWQDVGTVKLTSILTNNLVNEAHVAFQRYYTISNNGMPFTNTQVGIAPLNSSLPQLSQIGITNEIQMGAETLFGLRLANDQTEAGDQISWTHGKHSFRAGAELEHDYVTISIAGLGLGAPTFPSFPDFLIGRCEGTGCALSNGGSNSNETSPGGTAIVGYNGQFTSRLPVDTVSAFMQDDFKVNSRFTLNLGLRWEWFGQVKTYGGQWSNTWPSLLNTVPIPGTGCGTTSAPIGAGPTGTGCSLAGFEVPSNFAGPIPQGVYQSSSPFITQKAPALDNFGPRVGFAWQPLSSSRLAVRGGGGYFYDRPNGIPVTESGHSNPPYAFGVAQSNLESLSNPFVIPPTVPGPAGTPGWTPRWVFGTVVNNAATTATSSNLSGNQTLAQNFSNGLVYEWNVNTQYEFLPSWVLEVGYVGSHGIRQTAGTAGGNGIVANTTLGGNSPPINTASLASAGSPLSCGFDGNPQHCVTSNLLANLNLRVPYLGMASGFAPVSNTGQTLYNSLQMTVRKQLSHGLMLQAAYTWARAFINFYVGNPAATQPGIAPYIETYGLNTAYRPQRLVFNYSWDLPLGKHDGVMGQLLNGWNWSGVTTIQDGAPLLITDSTAGTIFFTGTGPIGLATLAPGATSASVVTSGSLDSRVIGGYFNKAAFTTPVVVGNGKGFGNYGLGEILGPGQNDWDMTVSKNFKIKESQTLQFRTEFFNTFNHPQFSNPFANVGQASSFGTITSTAVNPRIMQFALKYSF